MRRAPSILLVLLLAASAAPLGAAETLRYRWSIDGFVGAIVGLFMPTEGEGVLSLAPSGADVLRSELEVTSSESRRGEFFRYGAEWREPDGPTLRAWSEQLWRGEKKSKHAELGDAGVIDIVSGIAMLRRHPPESQQRLEIWSDGKLYPVIVLPRGEQRKRVGGREIATRHLSVRGIAEPDRRVWKGELDLWLAHDAAATPVEILVTRGGARVRLTLTGYSPPPAAEPEPLVRTEPEGSP